MGATADFTEDTAVMAAFTAYMEDMDFVVSATVTSAIMVLGTLGFMEATVLVASAIMGSTERTVGFAIMD